MPGVAADNAVARPEAVAAAIDALGGLIDDGGLARLDVPIGPMTTYRVGGNAAVFVSVSDRSQLPLVAAAQRASGLPVLTIGRGSNMLIADSGFDGIVVAVGDRSNTFEIDVERSVVTAAAGMLLPVVARKTAAAALTGFEWAVGVPGSIGGAVKMNAGGHGSDMAACVLDVVVADLAVDAASERTLGVDELGLRFRSSDVTATMIVLEVRLQLAPGERATAEREISDIVAWRRANQPGGQNAGSVFVNPVPGEVSAGALIDAAGLRGLRLGTAHVSEKHANFIQADDGGSAADVRALMRLVRERVEQSSGYALRSEIRLIGFDENTDEITDETV